MAQQCPFEDADKAKDYARDLFTAFFSIVSDINIGRQKVESKRKGPVHDYDGSEDDVSSEDSADDDVQIQQQQTEQDLEAEMGKLEISPEASTLETLILIVEHHIKSGDVEGFRKNMRRPDLWLMTSPRPKIDDVIKMAAGLVENNLPFRAVLMYKCACALYKYEYVRHPERDDVTADDVTPDDAIRGIELLMWKVTEIFNTLFVTDSKGIYLSHFIPVMYDMLTNLREIRHTDRRLKAQLEAWGLNYIAYTHGRVGETTEMQDVAITAVQLLEKRLKRHAPEAQAYGIALFMESLAKYLSGDFVEAGEAAGAALKSLQVAEGFSDWDEKVKMVEKAKLFVEDIRKATQ